MFFFESERNIQGDHADQLVHCLFIDFLLVAVGGWGSEYRDGVLTDLDGR